MTATRRGDLTTGSLVGKCLSFGFPLALAMMAHGFFNLVDMMIVARLGQGAVAAVTVGGLILPVALLLFDGVNGVTVALIAQAHGARDTKTAHEVAWESLLLSLGASVVLGGAFALLSGPLVAFFELGDEKTIAEGTAYLRVMSVGMAGMFLILQTTSVLRALGSARGPLIILVGANVLNLGLDVLFVFGGLGIPPMGVVGAALATVLSQLLGALLGFWLLWKGTHGLSLRAERFDGRFRWTRVLLVRGVSTSIQLVARVLAVFFVLRIARSAYSGNGVAFLDGIGICVRLEMTAIFLGLGWAAAASPLVGQCLGALAPDRAAKGVWILALLSAASMAIVGIALYFFRVPIFRFVMPQISDEALLASAEYLQVTVAFFGLMGLAFVLSRALNGAGSVRTPMVVDLVLYLLLLQALAVVLSGKDVGFGTRGVWIALVTTHSLAALAYAVVFRRGRWRRKRLLKNERNPDV